MYSDGIDSPWGVGNDPETGEMYTVNTKTGQGLDTHYRARQGQFERIASEKTLAERKDGTIDLAKTKTRRILRDMAEKILAVYSHKL
ncbi:hypothetical protein JKY72_01105 [Candidatus Gracilibacteria bacterium]|nr:hypothetical protein [Candidatus Gracilibacteria bacterium]